MILLMNDTIIFLNFDKPWYWLNTIWLIVVNNHKLLPDNGMNEMNEMTKRVVNEEMKTVGIPGRWNEI